MYRGGVRLVRKSKARIPMGFHTFSLFVKVHFCGISDLFPEKSYPGNFGDPHSIPVKFIPIPNNAHPRGFFPKDSSPFPEPGPENFRIRPGPEFDGNFFIFLSNDIFVPGAKKKPDPFIEPANHLSCTYLGSPTGRNIHIFL